MESAIGLWHCNPQDFRYLTPNGMCTDRSWARAPPRIYLNVYHHQAQVSKTPNHWFIRALIARYVDGLLIQRSRGCEQPRIIHNCGRPFGLGQSVRRRLSRARS